MIYVYFMSSVVWFLKTELINIKEVQVTSPSSPTLLPQGEKGAQTLAISDGGDIMGVGDAWLRRRQLGHEGWHYTVPSPVGRGLG